jgi:hypothetical protein
MALIKWMAWRPGRQNHKTEFLGKLAIPLLKMKNHEKKWFALKGRHFLKTLLKCTFGLKTKFFFCS